MDRSASFSESKPPLRPESGDALGFMPVSELSALVRSRAIRSVELAKIYLERLKRYNPMLRCVVNFTESLAMEQAERADRELDAGVYRGPLHGIPWGAKDLISVSGVPTTWGMPVFKDRVLDETATVAERLRDAGAVLIAKLSLGAIAMGDRSFGQMTRNPWNPKQGSSGSSAGSASATVAGCVGFSLGSETLGSIISPSTRCGATGLRPTFGRVSRHGCMPLSWTMDKIGPICRSVEDCAVVFGAIHGADGRDQTAVNQPFQWPADLNLRGLRVGVVRRENADSGREEAKILEDLGCKLVEIQLPKDYPLRAMIQVIDVEGAETFGGLLRSGQTDGWNDWPNIFRSAHFMSAVDYLKIMRVRRKLMLEMEQVMSQVDVMFNCSDLLHTNLTGHPSVILPWRVTEREGVRRPQSAIFTGHLFDESRLLAVANAFQRLVDGHLQSPPLDAWMEQFNAGTLDTPPQEKPADPPAESKDGDKAPANPGKDK